MKLQRAAAAALFSSHTQSREELYVLFLVAEVLRSSHNGLNYHSYSYEIVFITKQLFQAISVLVRTCRMHLFTCQLIQINIDMVQQNYIHNSTRDCFGPIEYIDLQLKTIL